MFVMCIYCIYVFIESKCVICRLSIFANRLRYPAESVNFDTAASCGSNGQYFKMSIICRVLIYIFF